MAKFYLRNIYMNFKFKKILNWFLLIFWMGVIFFLSSQPDLKSGLESSIDFVLRKLAHVSEYAILTFLAWRALIAHHDKRDIKFLIIVIAFSVLYAISDEYHQIFVFGRSGNPRDVAIDGIGIVVAAMFIKKRGLKDNSVRQKL